MANNINCVQEESLDGAVGHWVVEVCKFGDKASSCAGGGDIRDRGIVQGADGVRGTLDFCVDALRLSVEEGRDAGDARKAKGLADVGEERLEAAHEGRDGGAAFVSILDLVVANVMLGDVLDGVYFGAKVDGQMGALLGGRGAAHCVDENGEAALVIGRGGGRVMLHGLRGFVDHRARRGGREGGLGARRGRPGWGGWGWAMTQQSSKGIRHPWGGQGVLLPDGATAGEGGGSGRTS